MTVFDLLEISHQELVDLSFNVSTYYVSFPIPKSSGKLRWIHAPQGKLKELQYKILYRLLYQLSPHDAAVGFVKHRGVKFGAKKHLGAKILICCDLKDFFPSIKRDPVTRILHRACKVSRLEPISDSALFHLANCCLLNGGTPQGASTSPAIANLAARNLDISLTKLSKNLPGGVYTRYADDITISAKINLNPSTVKETIDSIMSKINLYGFRANKEKTRVLRPHRRMEVTGVVINEKINAPKFVWRNLRAQIHNLQVNQVTLTQEEFQKLRGKVEWINSLNPQRGNQLLQSLGKIPVSK